MMKPKIDCLIIGPYEMEFAQHERILSALGKDNPVYKNTNLRFIKKENKAYSAFEFFKLSVFQQKPDANEKTFEMFSNAIAYLGTYLINRGYSFDYINSFPIQKEELAEKLQNSDVLSIALVTTTYGNPIPIKKLISFIRKYNTDAKIIVGGPYINGEIRNNTEIDAHSILKSIGADIYVNSTQGEESLTKVLRALKENASLNKVPNLFFKHENSFIKTEVLNENNDLGENLIQWELFKDNLPNQVFSRLSISCPFKCSFCDFPQRMGDYKYLDIKDVEKELDSIERTGKVKSVSFVDDTINVPVPRFKEILRMMIRKKYSFKWHCLFRCQFADEEMVKLMAESGCESVHLGIESGSEQILLNMNKKATLEQFSKGVQLLNKYNIITYASFIIGFPGETKQTVNETIKFIEDSNFTFYILHPWYCSPMTPIWKEKEKYELSGDWAFNWKHKTMHSGEAVNYVEEIITKIKNSIHSPLHLQEIMILLHNGLSIDQIKDHLINFNHEIIKKLDNLSVS